MCVLSLLTKGDRYGYELTDAVSKEMDIAAGTLYLILKRLKTDGLVTTYLVESSDGPARKYYRLTEQGAQAYYDMAEQWRDFVRAVSKLTGIK